MLFNVLEQFEIILFPLDIYIYFQFFIFYLYFFFIYSEYLSVFNFISNILDKIIFLFYDLLLMDSNNIIIYNKDTFINSNSLVIYNIFSFFMGVYINNYNIIIIEIIKLFLILIITILTNNLFVDYLLEALNYLNNYYFNDFSFYLTDPNTRTQNFFINFLFYRYHLILDPFYFQSGELNLFRNHAIDYTNKQMFDSCTLYAFSNINFMLDHFFYFVVTPYPIYFLEEIPLKLVIKKISFAKLFYYYITNELYINFILDKFNMDLYPTRIIIFLDSFKLIFLYCSEGLVLFFFFFESFLFPSLFSIKNYMYSRFTYFHFKTLYSLRKNSKIRIFFSFLLQIIKSKIQVYLQLIIKVNFGLHYPFFQRLLNFFPFFLLCFSFIVSQNYNGLFFLGFANTSLLIYNLIYSSMCIIGLTLYVYILDQLSFI